MVDALNVDHKECSFDEVLWDTYCLKDYTKGEDQKFGLPAPGTHALLLRVKDSSLSFCQTARDPNTSNIGESIKELVGYIEEELNCKDFHMRILPQAHFDSAAAVWSKDIDSLIEIFSKTGGVEAKEEMKQQFNSAFFIFVFGKSSPWKAEAQAPDPFSTLSDESFINYTDKVGTVCRRNVKVKETVILKEKNLQLRGVLDAQGRMMYVVVTERREVQRLSELSSKELREFFALMVKLVHLNSPPVEKEYTREEGEMFTAQYFDDIFEDIRINAGSFQNIRSLHGKIWMPKEQFMKVWGNSDVFRRLTEEDEFTVAAGEKTS